MNVRLEFNSNPNWHGTQREDEPWNQETVRGWRLCTVRLESYAKYVTVAGSKKLIPKALMGYRFILYRPDGRWWNLDVIRNLYVSYKVLFS